MSKELVFVCDKRSSTGEYVACVYLQKLGHKLQRFITIHYESWQCLAHTVTLVVGDQRFGDVWPAYNEPQGLRTD